MTGPLVSAETMIRRGPIGVCLYSLSRLDAGAEEVDYLIREETARVRVWRSPDVEFRPSVIGRKVPRPDARIVLLVPILIRVGGELYECWVNHWADLKTQRVLGTLAIQERLVLHFYGDSGDRLRSLAVSNPHQAFWAEAARQCASSLPWSMPEYDAAREEVYAEYPTVGALWKTMSQR